MHPCWWCSSMFISWISMSSVEPTEYGFDHNPFLAVYFLCLFNSPPPPSVPPTHFLCFSPPSLSPAYLPPALSYVCLSLALVLSLPSLLPSCSFCLSSSRPLHPFVPLFLSLSLTSPLSLSLSLSLVSCTWCLGPLVMHCCILMLPCFTAATRCCWGCFSPRPSAAQCLWWTPYAATRCPTCRPCSTPREMQSKYTHQYLFETIVAFPPPPLFFVVFYNGGGGGGGGGAELIS